MTLAQIVRCGGPLVGGFGVFSLAAQNLLPNPGFEAGTDTPSAWRLADGRGERAQCEPGGLRAGPAVLRVIGGGTGLGYWRTDTLDLRPGGLYRLRFVGRRLAEATGGTAVAGPSRVNRDFPLGPEWAEHAFVLRLPDDGGRDFVRLGQWEVKGAIEFDDVVLSPVLVAHAQPRPGLELGDGESLRGGVYRFQPHLDWAGANAHRPLATNRAGFNSNRWVFWDGAQVVYRQEVGAIPQQSAKVRLNVNYHQAGTLTLEASREGTSWIQVGEFDAGHRAGELELPAALFPTPVVWVRLTGRGPGANLQVDSYAYEARLAEPPADARGGTQFLEVLEANPALTAQLRRLEVSGEGDVRLELGLANRSSKVVAGAATLETEDRQTATRSQPVRIDAGADAAVRLTASAGGAGERSLTLRVADAEGGTLFRGRATLRLGFLSDRSYGYPLAGSLTVPLWWCESGWKVGRERGIPDAPTSGRPSAVRVSAAQGEYEAAQVILRPTRDGTLRGVEVGRFRGPGGEASDIAVTVCEVAYVLTEQPTDASCVAGWHPDPLPPLETPLAFGGGRNLPLWVTFEVGRGVAAGVHRGELTLWTTLGPPLRVPLEVTVYDFEMPRDTHLHSALGLGEWAINRYHRLTNRADQVAVFEKYLANFAAHRISPYSFFEYAPIEVRFEGEGPDKRARVDFARFDPAARKWLDEHRFSTFQLPLQGMGGGTFHSRHLGELAGFKEGTPEHARLFKDYLGQVERHLREQGWIGKAFTYWFDEPDPKDYEFVVAGMKRLKEAAPGIRRMLTEQPESELIGHVEIWCGLTPEWTPEKVRARRDAGEEVWWYLCTGPKAPYLTLFLDHPGTELRLWPWQSWQYGVTGILVWATVYWTSPVAYPEPALQDPWTDPMSWVSGYGTPVGTRSPWGNGDGRFLYPPRRDPNDPAAPCLDGPINSMRWENLRDGIEDYEYFWLLEQEVKRVAASSGESEALRDARQLLVVPESVSKHLTQFTRDPRPLLEHREKVARTIERLRRAR